MANGTYQPGFLERHERVIALVVGIAMLILVGSLFWGLFAGGEPEKTDCGDDIGCFLQHAHACLPAIMERQIAGSVMRYEVWDKCTLIKGFSVISASEPRLVHELFGGKTMTCTYGEGKFNQRWINTITGDIAKCEGSLRDALLELMSAQEDLEVRAITE